MRQLPDNLRAGAPGCTVTGPARPGANVGNVSVLPIDVQKICPGRREERQTNFLSYDGQCLYMTLALWYGPPLDEANTQRLVRLVSTGTKRERRWGDQHECRAPRPIATRPTATRLTG